MKLQKAHKEQIKLRIGLSGASGFGKTYSALLMAYGIAGNWNKIAVIDTEILTFGIFITSSLGLLKAAI